MKHIILFKGLYLEIFQTDSKLNFLYFKKKYSYFFEKKKCFYTLLVSKELIQCSLRELIISKILTLFAMFLFKHTEIKYRKCLNFVVQKHN